MQETPCFDATVKALGFTPGGPRFTTDEAFAMLVRVVPTPVSLRLTTSLRLPSLAAVKR